MTDILFWKWNLANLQNYHLDSVCFGRPHMQKIAGNRPNELEIIIDLPCGFFPINNIISPERTGACFEFLFQVVDIVYVHISRNMAPSSDRTKQQNPICVKEKYFEWWSILEIWRFSLTERPMQSMIVYHPDWLRSPCTLPYLTFCVRHHVPSSHSRNHQNLRHLMTQSRLRRRVSIIRSFTLVRAPSSSSMALMLFSTIFWRELFHYDEKSESR